MRCRRCAGNAYLEMIDDPELRCLQCSRLVARLVPGGIMAEGWLPAAA